MNRLIVILYCLGFTCLPSCNSANIVVIMVAPFYSHQTAFNPVWLELARRGHNITIFQPDAILKDNENITNIPLNETYSILSKHGMFDSLAQGGSMIRFFSNARTSFAEVVEYQMTHPEMLKLLRGELKADLIFTELFALFYSALGKKLNIPVIGVISMDAGVISHANVGNPTHPIAYPDKDCGVSSTVLSFSDRVRSTIFWLGIKTLDSFLLVPLQEKSLKKHWGLTIDLNQLGTNLSMVFINSNPIFNPVRPLGPKTVNIGGGIHIIKAKPLTLELQQYLDQAEKGVIYFSLGSAIQSNQLPTATRDVILKTFSQLPYNILWKYDKKLDTPSNVKMERWFPQQDLLRHKNIKLFITQGGLQSVEESVLNHVPMIALPFYGDQFNNAEKLVAKGLGLSLDYTKLDMETFKEAIFEVTNNPKYKQRAKELADLVLDQPMTGVEKAVWWTEYLLRHGNTLHFRDPIVDLPLYQYLLLDVILFLLSVTTAFVYAVILTIRVLKLLVHKCIFRKKTKIKAD